MADESTLLKALASYREKVVAVATAQAELDVAMWDATVKGKALKTATDRDRFAYQACANERYTLAVARADKSIAWQWMMYVQGGAASVEDSE